MTFEGKTGIVAGGGSGIGAAIATGLGAGGAHVEIWDVNEQGGAAVAAGIVKSGGSATFTRMDVLDFAAVDAEVGRVVRDRGALDLLVSTVGGGDFKPFLEMDGAFFERELRLNLVSAFNVARAAAAPMVERNSGRMLFFTSTTGGEKGLTAYGASKAGLESVIKTMVAELSDTRIGINAVMPGLTDTLLARRSFARLPDGDAAWNHLAAALPFGANTPEEVADVSLFLLSDQAKRITGQIVALR